MKTINPISIDYTTLTVNSNIDADSYYDKYGTYYATINAWSSGTTYTIGQLAHYKNRVYQSIFNGSNLGFNPITGNTNLATGLNYWNDVGSLNKFAAFDTESNTQSISLTTELMFDFIPPSTFNAIGFSNIDVDYITISVVDAADSTNILWTETKSPFSRTVTDWYEWMNTPFPSSNNLFFDNITIFSGNRLMIYAVKSAGAPKIGATVIGRSLDIGKMELGVRTPMIDYSVVSTDEFGNTKLVRRNSYSAIDGTLRCEARQANLIRDLRRSLNAVPTVWIGVDGQDDYYYNSLFLLGVATTFEPVFDAKTEFQVKIYIKEI